MAENSKKSDYDKIEEVFASDAIEAEADEIENSESPCTEEAVPGIRIQDALKSLPIFDDLFLGMQAMNLDIVDGYIEQIEVELLREYIEIERTPVQAALFVSAMSQLWVFGLYELLRTWRQRVEDVMRFAENLPSIEPDRAKRVAEKKEQVEQASEAALDGLYYWTPFEKAASDENFVDALRRAFDGSELLYRRIEALRISLAKHEIPKSKAQYAMSPGYGRIDMTDGSIYWQIVLKGNHVDVVSRRTLADECRRIADDRSTVLLPGTIRERVSQFPREGYGLTRVATTLDDGTEYPEVVIAWSKQVVWVKGLASVSFDARRIIDVRHVPKPIDLEKEEELKNLLPADMDLGD